MSAKKPPFVIIHLCIWMRSFWFCFVLCFFGWCLRFGHCRTMMGGQEVGGYVEKQKGREEDHNRVLSYVDSVIYKLQNSNKQMLKSKKKKKKVLDFSIFFPPFIPAEGRGSWWELPADLNSRCSTPSSNYRYDTSVTQPRSWSESESSRKRLLTCPCLLTVVLLQQLHGSEQHGPVLRISDVQLVQVLLLQQLERVQVLIAVEQESGHVLLRDRDMWVEKPRMKVSKYALDLSHRTENKLRNQG